MIKKAHARPESADGLVWLHPASQLVPIIILDNDNPSTCVLGICSIAYSLLCASARTQIRMPGTVRRKYAGRHSCTRVLYQRTIFCICSQ